MEEEADSAGAHLGFLGDGDVSASQKSPVDMHNKEFADSDGRKAEVTAGRNTSFLGEGGTGERLQNEGC